MTRPASHRYQIPKHCCGNCEFSHIVEPTLDLLCFHGDNIRVIGERNNSTESEFIEIDGEDIVLMSNDRYSEIWAGGIVDSDNICDEWRQKIQ